MSKRCVSGVPNLLACGILAFLPTAVWSAEGGDSAAGGGDHEATGGHEEGGGSHESEHYHKNHVSVFLGATEAEEEHGEKEDPDFTIGFDYERRLSKVVGVGFLADWVVEGRREWMLGVPLFLHAGRSAKFTLAPGFHHLNHSGDDEFVFRTGFSWDFELKNVVLAPAIFYDFTEGQDFLVLGLNIGKGF